MGDMLNQLLAEWLITQGPGAVTVRLHYTQATTWLLEALWTILEQPLTGCSDDIVSKPPSLLGG
jgi:hypothetical protein